MDMDPSALTVMVPWVNWMTVSPAGVMMIFGGSAWAVPRRSMAQAAKVVRVKNRMDGPLECS
jgi:hypothetical protein